MASAPFDERAVAARHAAYRRAAEWIRHFADLLGQSGHDPSKRTQIHTSARMTVDTIVRLLAPAGAVPASISDAVELDAWVRLLDELLTEAQAGYDRAQEQALPVAASVAVDVARIAGVEGR